MNSLRIIEIYYNISRNKNYFKERDRLIIDGVLSPSIKSIHISELYPKQLFYLNVNVPVPIRLTRGTTKIPKVFEYAVRYKCFRDIFEDRSFLEIALDTDNHTFFEDEWFIKAFEKLINYFDKQTIKPQKVLYCVKDDKEIYKYAFNIILSSLIHIATVMILGLCFNLLIESLTFYCAYIVIRKFAGGYHAKRQQDVILFLL